MKLPSYKRSSEAVSSIAYVEPQCTEPSTAKFFKILEYTQLTVRQISSGSSQNWSIGTDFTHVPRVSPATSFKLSSIAGLQLSLYVAVLLSLMYVVNPVRIGDGGNSGSTWNRVSLGHLGSNWVTSGQILNDLNLSFSYISQSKTEPPVYDTRTPGFHKFLTGGSSFAV